MKLRDIHSIHDPKPGMFLLITPWFRGQPSSKGLFYLVLSWDWENNDVSYISELGVVQKLIKIRDGLYDGMFVSKEEMIDTYERIIVKQWKIVESFEEDED